MQTTKKYRKSASFFSSTAKDSLCETGRWGLSRLGYWGTHTAERPKMYGLSRSCLQTPGGFDGEVALEFMVKLTMKKSVIDLVFAD